MLSLSKHGAGFFNGLLWSPHAREHVGHLWLVDPMARTLEVYRLNGNQWIVASTHGGVDAVRPEPFQAIEIDLTRWWLEA